MNTNEYDIKLLKDATKNLAKYNQYLKEYSKNTYIPIFKIYIFIGCLLTLVSIFCAIFITYLFSIFILGSVIYTICVYKELRKVRNE